MESIKLNDQPRPLVICGPSGVGKGTIIKELLKQHPLRFGLSVSHTTRKKRETEVDQADYYFVERSQMWKAIQQGKFIESSEFAGNLYGTSKNAILNVIYDKKICILDLNLEGVENIKKSMDCLFLFIAPPSMEILEGRLKERNTETEEEIQIRLRIAKMDLKFLNEHPDYFHKVIVNESLKDTCDEVIEWVFKSEEERKKGKK